MGTNVGKAMCEATATHRQCCALLQHLHCPGAAGGWRSSAGSCEVLGAGCGPDPAAIPWVPRGTPEGADPAKLWHCSLIARCTSLMNINFPSSLVISR